MSAVGRRIDRYLVEAELDAGGFGTVYRARHTVIGRTVALKLLHASRSASLAVVERFLREARIVASLSSPHVVQVLDAGMTDDRELFLAMELLQGDSLAQRLARSGPIPMREALSIGRQILAGLAAAHAAGVVHRDLKPANVFLARTPDRREIAKVLDFGISKSRSGGEGDVITMTGAVMGTPHYMAPEQLHGARDVDGRADLYAFAVVLYEMLSGRLPYEAQTLEHLIAKRMHDPPAPLGSVAPHLPRELIAVVERGLARDPDGRFRSAQDFDAALGRLESVPMPATATPQRVIVSASAYPPSPSMALGATHATPGGAATGPVASGAVMIRSPVARGAAPTPSDTAASLPPGTTRLPTRSISIGLMALALAGAVLVIVVLGAALASVTTAWFMSRGPDTPAPIAVAPPVTASPQVAPPAPYPLAPPPIAPPQVAPAAIPVTPPVVPAAARPTSAYVDTVLGDVDARVVEVLIERATPAIDRCRRSVDDDVRVQLLTGPSGAIAIAQPDPNAPHGDDATARCVARALRDAGPLADGDGIVVIEAHLSAR